MKAQSYVLDITEDAIVLTGDEAGLWHGMQTLLQDVYKRQGLHREAPGKQFEQ